MQKAGLFVALLLMLALPARAEQVSQAEAHQIGTEAYLYFYPLVTMDVSRRLATNVEAGKEMGRGPMNTFIHMRTFPPADFRDVVRPNFDTLYSIVWLDLTKGPVLISAPDTNGRYYLLPMLDMWTDVFASPGKRTTGTKAETFAVVPPGWRGELPKAVTRIDAPTPYVWMIGRIQTNGPQDYAAVNKIQDSLKITDLAGEPIVSKVAVDPSVDSKTPPLDQVNKMPAEKYFSYAAELMKVNAPHITDQSMIARLKRIGIEPGKSFDFDKLSPAVQEGLRKASKDGLKNMVEKTPTLARVVNGWQMNTDTMGVYGNYYLKRAIVAMVGLGANQPEDAIYPLNIVDSKGKILHGSNKYVLKFKKDELPPVNAFWSTTLYDQAGFQVPNSLNRFAIGDRDALKYNADGSLEIYVQNTSPGKGKESNWLPTPKGPFSLTMRLYAPKLSVLEGKWVPPAVVKK